MKNSLKRLSVSIFVLFVAVCLVATSAYAWFTMSTSPSTGSFDLTVTTTDGLYISASGIDGTYKTSLTTSEILNVYQAIPQLDAVTYGDSAGGISYDYRDINGGTFTNGGFTQVATYSRYKEYYEEGEAEEITAYVNTNNFSLFDNCNIMLYKGADAENLEALNHSSAGVTFGTDKIWTKTQKATVTSQADISNAGHPIYQYNAKYYEFNLYFMGSNPYSVYANISNSTVETVGREDITLGVDLWKDSLAKASYLVGADLEGSITETPIKAFASDAVKVGFWTGSTLQNIWEPDKALTATSGDLDDLQVGDYSFTQQSAYIQGGTTGDTNIALNYYNFKNNLTGEAAKNCTGYAFPAVNQVTVENAGGSNAALMQLLTLTQVGSSTVYKGTLTVKIWIDGWDADCFDSIFDQAVRTTLEFFSK